MECLRSSGSSVLLSEDLNKNFCVIVKVTEIVAEIDFNPIGIGGSKSDPLDIGPRLGLGPISGSGPG